MILTSRTGKDLDAVAGEVRERGGEAVPIRADLGRIAEIEALARDVTAAFGRLDVLVNNAGMLPPARQVYDVPLPEWTAVMDLNLRAPWYLSCLLHSLLKQSDGACVVNVASAGGLKADIGFGVYSVAKAALCMLTTVCAKEWARDGIRVNAIAPGLVDTDMAAPIRSYLDSHQLAPNPLGVIAAPSDIATLVVLLASRRSRMMTGEVVRIDAGELL